MHKHRRRVSFARSRKNAYSYGYINAVCHARERAGSYKRIHIRRKLEQSLESYREIFVVYNAYGQKQTQLHYGVCKRMSVHIEKRRKRQPDHGPHAQIQQQEPERKREKEPET